MKTRQWLAMLATVIAAALGGWWVGARLGPDSPGPLSAASPAGPCPAGANPLYWKAPMDPTYIRDEPGQSPMGMDLVPVCLGETAAGGADSVRIAPMLIQSMGVRTEPAARRALSRKVRTVGRVTYDERRVSHVHTKVQGWIERLFVGYEGDLVKHGQPLLEIYSPELVSTAEELLLAKRYRDSTRRSRFEDVSRGGAELFRAARRRLELWDIAERDIERLLETGQVQKTLTLNAPTEGVVTHLMVRQGMEIGPNNNLYTIADLSRVWLYADVYEYELPWVREGQNATIELSYLPGHTFEGTVTYVSLFLDPKTRTARVRIELDNPGLLLKPDMFANVTIETGAREDVLAVPEEAVIRSGRRSLVVVTNGGGRFAPREVRLGVDSGDGWVEVQDGLAEGDRVVTSGQFLIDSESKLQEAIQKMLVATPAMKHERAGTQVATPAHAAHTPSGHGLVGSAGHAMMEHGETGAPASAPTHAGHTPPRLPHGLVNHAGHALMEYEATGTEP